MNTKQRILRGVLTPLLATFVFGAPAFAATILVDDDGSGDYLTISEAVANAVDGDVIIVAPGTYVEEVIVDVSVTIAGSGMGQTIVTPSVSNPGSGNGSQVTTTTWIFRIQADDVTLSGMTVDGNNPALSVGIDARGAIITDYSAGSFDALEVVSCEILNVAYRGIYPASGGTGHSFVLNRVRNVQDMYLDSVGIFFYGAEGEARDNDVADCSIGIGFQTGGGGTFADNVLADCDLGILANGSTAPVTIEGNTITACDQGVQTIALNTTADILDNTMVGCGTGVTLFGLGTGSNVVDGNVIDGEGVVDTNGVFLTTDCTPWGYATVIATLTDNVLSNTDLGVVLYESDLDNSPVLDCTISAGATDYNTFTGSGTFNVYLQDCNDDVDATHNFWGAVSPALIEDTLWHQVDDPALGLIDFSSTVNLLVTVDDDGPADFTTINPAVQSLLPGGTVLVMPGLYIEDVVIDRTCVVTGSGTDSDPALGTVLQGASIHPDMMVIAVTADDVVIENLRVDGQQPVYTQARRAIYGSGISGLTVTDCVVHTATTGISYATSTDGTFLRNEVFDFGKSLQEGGGIFLWNGTGIVGTPRHGNYVHDGVATGIIFHNSSNGTASFNVVDNCELGFLCNGASDVTAFERNEARNCPQGYQGIGNHAAVDYVENTAFDCATGFVLFGLGAELHTYTDNYVRHRLAAVPSKGFYFTTECVFGDDDANAEVRGNIVSGANVGIYLDETAGSSIFAMNVDLNGTTNPNWITGAMSQDILLWKCDDDIDAAGNYFGSTNPAVVEDKITHQADDPTLGLVNFTGLLAPGPDMRRRGELFEGHEIALICTGAPGDPVIPFWGNDLLTVPFWFGVLEINPTTAHLLAIMPVESSGLEFTEANITWPLGPGDTHYFQALIGVPGAWTFTNLTSATAP